MSMPIIITKGQPTAEEIAALTTVFSILSAQDAARNPGAKDYWMVQQVMNLRSPYGVTPRDTRSNFSLAF